MSRTAIIARAIGVIGATTVLATGVTWAALTSNNVSLAANSISTVNAAVQIYDGTGWNSTSATGFTITGLKPGTESAAKPFYLKNNGTADLKLAVRVPVEPTSTGFSGWQNLKVTISDEFGNSKPTDMAALLAGPVEMPGNNFPTGAEGNGSVLLTKGNYNIKFKLESSSILPGSSSASVGNFDLEISGEQQ